MLPGLPSYQASLRLVDELARRMREHGGDLDHPDLPAGYTYFGQLVNHDLSFDPVSSLRRRNDPAGVEDFRTPRFDLDMVYGGGPEDMPYLYAQHRRARGELLLVGDSRAQFGGRFASRDLPRNAEGRALIGDPRNDENAILAQLHLVFLQFHNRVVGDLGDGDLFGEAQRIVRWHYQWVVARDFLPRVLPAGLIEGLLGRGGPPVDRRRRRLVFDGAPFMPVEFAAAAFRFGHTLVRPSYQVNAHAQNVRLFATSPDPLDAGHLGGFRPLPAGLVVDWSRFLDLDPAAPPQPARRLDTRLAAPLTRLPAGVGPPGTAGRSLAWLNLTRGNAMGLPSGQAVAAALGAPPVAAAALRLAGAPAPLWYYLLAEAATLGGGRRLGPAGATIVAETIAALLWADPGSFVHATPPWTPFLGPEPGRFTLADLVAYATENR
jgi:Animal haem peroxidase